MAEPDLAPRNGNAGKQDIHPDNPFASPPSISNDTLACPRPCFQPPQSLPPVRTAGLHESASARHDRKTHQPVHGTNKAGSMSSTADSTIMTPVSSIDLEKAALAKEHAPKSSSRDSNRSKGSRGSKASRGSKTNRDLEKAMPHSHHSSRRSSNHGAPRPVALVEDEDELDEGQDMQEKKAVKILLFLSGPCVVLSSINTVWACIALVITALSQPIRLCAKRPTFGQQLAGLLGPTLNLQLKCIYTPLPPHADEDASYHTFMLIVVHLLSPFLSFVMMFAAWVLAVYWVSSVVVGDPAGQDKRDDGKETVLGLRRWWERWLMRSMKDE